MEASCWPRLRGHQKGISICPTPKGDEGTRYFTGKYPSSRRLPFFEKEKCYSSIQNLYSYKYNIILCNFGHFIDHSQSFK